MAEMNRINSFKSFTEVKDIEKTNKLREENQTKRKKLSQKFESILDELGITSYEELDEKTKKTLFSKILGKSDVEEGNAFGDAVKKAKDSGKKEFELDGKTHKVEEGNAFIYAAAKAKQEGKDSFEFNGKTYKVTLKKDNGLRESYKLVVTEAKAWEIGKDYPSYGVVVGIKQDGDLCEVSFDSGENIVFRDTGSKWVQESTVTEGRVKQFETDMASMIKNIKSGYGWIDPEYVANTWENSSDSIDFELVKGEIYKRLIAAKLLAYADEDEEDAGQYVKSLKELGIRESVVNEAKFDKSKLLKALGKNHDGEILVNGNTYVIYNPDSGNDENTAMWNDKTIFAVDQDGEEFEFKYSEIERFNESIVTEAKFKNTKDFESFLEEIDSMPESAIKKIMGKDYIDTPGFYQDEKEDYDNDIIEFMISNMGSKEFEKLQDWWESNVAESVVTEGAKEDALYKKQQLAKLKAAKKDSESKKSLLALQQKKNQARIKKANESEVKSDDEFKEYAMAVLKKAFGDDFDEAKAEKVVSGILKQADGDYGAAVGMLTSSLGE